MLISGPLLLARILESLAAWFAAYSPSLLVVSLGQTPQD